MIQIFTGEDGVGRSEALTKELNLWLGPLVDDPYSREIIFLDDKSADYDPIQKVYESIGSPSMFAEKKAIVLKNFQAVKASQLEELIKLFEENNIDENGIFIEATTIDARSKAGKKLKTMGTLHNFNSPKPWEIPAWIESEAKRQGFKVNSYCAKFMSEFFIANTVVIKSEIEKLRLQFPDLTELNEKIILDNLSGTNEGNIFEWLNLFGMRQKGECIIELQKILTAGTHPLAIISPLYNHVSKLLQIKSMLAMGLGEKDIAKEVKMHEFLFKKNKMLNQAGRRSNNVLQRVLIRIVDIDAALKKGNYSYLPDFELTIFEIL